MLVSPTLFVRTQLRAARYTLGLLKILQNISNILPIIKNSKD